MTIIQSPIERRLFLGGAALASGAFFIDPALAAPRRRATRKRPVAVNAVSGTVVGQRHLHSIGIQLYTIREIFKKDPYGTIRMLGQLGYNELEYAHMDYAPAGPLPIGPAELRKVCDAAGIRITSGHFNPPLFANTPDLVKRIADTLGCRYVVNSWIDQKERTRDGYYRQAEWFNRVGKGMRASGLHYAFHNHEFEFEKMDGDKSGQDILFQNTDPAVVDFELDMHWVVVGGADNISLIKQYPGRIKMCHVKDRTADGKMVSVGDGVIPWGDIFSHYQMAGLEHFYVEDDEPPVPERAAVKRSIDWLRKLRF
jgi:sugar phosphate isomerase/epimerase